MGLMYRVFAGPELLGESDLPERDAAMGVAIGKFHPAPRYDTVRPVFLKFADALPTSSAESADSRALVDYYQCRDALGLSIRTALGEAVTTEWVHIEDFGDIDDLKVSARIDREDSFWEPRKEFAGSNPPPISVGTIIRNSSVALPYEGVVCTLERPPKQSWIERQWNRDLIDVLPPQVQWWGVAPFTGGFALCPEPHLEWLRMITPNDYELLMEHCNDAGMSRIRELFPHLHADYMAKLWTKL